jgi:hypothetical protein
MPMQKYRPLGEYLVKQYKVSVLLTFQEIEQILGFILPPSAYSHRAWWANNQSHPQAGSWLNVGWKVSKVDMGKKMALLVHPLILSLQKVIDDGEVISLTATIMASMDNENFALIVSGPNASATVAYSWQQIVQTLIDANPHLFGNLTNQPDHHIFPEMLAKLGYTVTNQQTGETWKAKTKKVRCP